MQLSTEDCEKIKLDTHPKYNKHDSELKDNFKTKQRIWLQFEDIVSHEIYEGIYEIGESVTKTSFEFKTI